MFEFTREFWTERDYCEYIDRLKENRDEKYKEFHSGLSGEGNSELIGVRTPILRSIAKEIIKGNAKAFLKQCGSQYYEEIVIEGMVIVGLKLSYEDLYPLVDEYINKISSWAINDMFCSGLKQVKKDKALWFERIARYLESDNSWEIRFGLVLMLNYFLEEKYIKEVLARTDKIKNEHYYVKMAQAWLIATAFCKCREETMMYLRNNQLSKWVLNKSIQKIRESYRVSAEDKEYLLGLKIY